MASEKNTLISRYTTAARLNHWITAASLILLALSGFALFHPSLFFLTGLFGGGQMARIIHPFIGVVLVVSFLGLFLRFVWFNFLTMDDFRWLFRLGAVLRNDESRLPEVGRYNAGQKLYFWGMTFTILLLVTSGVVIWDVYFAQYFTLNSAGWRCSCMRARRWRRSCFGSYMLMLPFGCRAPSAR